MRRPFRAVILAAGLSTRMGKQKLLMPFRGRPMIEYAIEAAQAYSPLIVTTAELAREVHPCGYEVIINSAPERGMTHSLKLANDVIAPDVSLIVLLADKPLVTAKLIRRIRDAAQNADVAFPVNGLGQAGHPVVFSPHARTRIAALPDGDTLRALRDDETLTRQAVTLDDPGAYFDVDTVDDLGA